MTEIKKMTDFCRLEELRNPAVLESFKKDVGEANIFIGSLIFVQELADKVLT